MGNALLHKTVTIGAILFLLHAVAGGTCRAQAVEPLFRKISQQNGLSNNRVTCFLKDKKGYIWIGTALGLNRYDGLRFEQFMHNNYNPASLSWNVITALEEDKYGNIWIGTEAGGLNMYDPRTKKFTQYRAQPNAAHTIADDHIKCLKTDAEGNLWIGYNYKGWGIMQVDTKQFRHEKSGLRFINQWGANAADCVTGFAHDARGITWITTTYGLVQKNRLTGAITPFTDHSGRYYDQNENLFVKPVVLGDTALALATWGCGIKYFHLKDKKFSGYLFEKQYKQGAFTNIILDITAKNGSDFWVASADKGLGIFDAHAKTFRFFKHDPADAFTPPPKECRVVYFDKDGLLWAGFDYGLCYWAPSLQNFRTTHFNDFTGPAADNASVLTACYLQDVNTVFYARLFGKGLYAKHEPTGKITLHPFPRAFTRQDGTIYMHSIIPIQQGQLLLQTSTGWFTFNVSSGQIQQATITYEGRTVQPAGYSSTPDADGYAWFKDKQQHFYRMHLHSLTISMPQHKKPLQYPLQPYDFIAGTLHSGLLWVADKNRGLCILNTETNTTDTAYLEKGFTRINDAKAMVKDKQGHFWVTTYSSGLYEMWQAASGKYQYRHYTESDGLPDMFLSDVFIDSTQKLWIASRSGIISYDLKSDFRLFGISDGYSTDWSEINGLNFHPSGRMLISHQQGFSILDVYQIQKNTTPPPVVITSFKVNSREWIDSFATDPTRHLVLEHHQNFIGCSFVALNFIDAAQNRYAYQLEGVDKNWVYGGTSNEITYSDLKPGKYKFSVMASNNHGIWNTKPVTIYFTIQAPFWKQPWFTVCLLLLAALCIYVVYAYNIGVIRKEAALKTAFSKQVAEAEVKALRGQMNPHFIFNCLNTLDSYILQNKQLEASQLVQRFSKLIRRVLEHSAQTYISLSDEIKTLQIYLQLERMRQDNQFEFELHIAPDTAALLIPPMLVQPFVENAIIHGMRNRNSPGGIIRIITALSGNQIKITVQDNGVGRAKAMEIKAAKFKAHQSMSMELTRSRLEVLHGHGDHSKYLVIQDLTVPETGTSVEIFIPVIQDEHKNSA